MSDQLNDLLSENEAQYDLRLYVENGVAVVHPVGSGLSPLPPELLPDLDAFAVAVTSRLQRLEQSQQR